MADKTPLRLVLDGNSDPSGLAEFQTGDTLPLSVGGLGASLSLGSAGQVLKVNDGGTAVEFGTLSSDITLNDDTSSSVSGQNFSILGGAGISTALNGSELTVSIDSTVVTESSTDTLTNKTINSASNTITITESNISDLGSYITASSTDTLTNKTISGASNTISGLDAASIGDGSVSNTEFQYLDGVTSSIQTQLNAAASTGKAIAMSIVFG